MLVEYKTEHAVTLYSIENGNILGKVVKMAYPGYYIVGKNFQIFKNFFSFVH